MTTQQSVLLQTPLHNRHISRKALMAPFGGWSMPIQYTGIIEEHHHTRLRASLFDTCHMGEFLVEGSRATEDLDRIVTSSIRTLAIGQCRYGYILNDKGFILDDTIVYRKEKEKYMMVVNATTTHGDFNWAKGHASSNTQLTDISNQTAKIDFQGPLTRSLLPIWVKDSHIENLKYFHFIETAFDNIPCIVSRTGYTGEYGYELYFDAVFAGKIWDTLLSKSEVKPAGLGARDTLRLEVGYPLYGHDLDTTVTPFEADGMRFVDMTKPFIGQTALAKNHLRQKLVALAGEDRRSPRHKDPILFEGKNVGYVTSGSFSPSLKKGLALGYVIEELSQPGQALVIRGQKFDIPVTVTTLPFYKEGTARR